MLKKSFSNQYNYFDLNLDQITEAAKKQVPAFTLLGTQIVEVTPGFCKTSNPRIPQLDGFESNFHGGVLMTLADNAACFALWSKIGPEEKISTTDMNIRFLKPGKSSVTAYATVLKVGRSICPIEVKLMDSENNMIAVAQVTFIRLNKSKT